MKISSEPYDFDSSLAISGVLPQGAGFGNAIFATRSDSRSSSSEDISFSARFSICWAAVALVALARILFACATSWDACFSAFGALALAAALVGLALGQVRLPADVVDVDLGPVRVQVEDPGDGLLQQGDVVADHDHAARDTP